VEDIALVSRPVYATDVRNASVRTFNDKQNDIKRISSKSLLSVVNSGTGTIVDSGTTDSYFPREMEKAFTTTFKQITGHVYSNIEMTLTPYDYEKLPSLVIRVKGSDDREPYVDIEISPHNYMEAVGKESQYIGGSTRVYIPRIYFTEHTGAVLGSNFLIGYSTTFDMERKRIGFMKSDCLIADSSVSAYRQDEKQKPVSKEIASSTTATETKQINKKKEKPTAPFNGKKHNNKNVYYSFLNENCSLTYAVDPCPANCNSKSSTNRHPANTAQLRGVPRIYIVNASQTWINNIDCLHYQTNFYASSTDAEKIAMLSDLAKDKSPKVRSCEVHCDKSKQYSGAVDCPTSAWSKCSRDCRQYRIVGTKTGSQCVHHKESRSCAYDQCPVDKTSTCNAFIQISLPQLKEQLWSDVRGDDIVDALATLFHVRLLYYIKYTSVCICSMISLII
jgi:hypothetical protein